MASLAPIDEKTFADRVREEVERTIDRGRKGIRYLRSDPPDVGMTPRDEIHARGTLRLYHYKPVADEVYRVPLLLVMSLATIHRDALDAIGNEVERVVFEAQPRIVGPRLAPVDQVDIVAV